jgi:hypothetical protein
MAENFLLELIQALAERVTEISVTILPALE